MSATSINPNGVQGAATQVVSTAPHVFIVPFIADLSVDAEGEIGVTKKADVTITNIDAMFDVSMNAAQAVKLLNAFYIKDSDSDFSKNATDASSGTIVDVFGPGSEKGDDMISAIRFAITNALSVSTYQAVGEEKTSVARRSVHEYVRYQGYKDTLDSLMSDTLAGLLEASDLNSYDVVVDNSGGAYKMDELMSAEPDDATKTPGKYRRSIFTQLPESNIEAYIHANNADNSTALSVEDVSGLSLLPLLNKDKLVFVFDVTIGEVTSMGGNYWTPAVNGAAMSRVFIDRYSLPDQAGKVNTLGGLVDVTATDSEYADGTLTVTRPSKRRIAIRAEVNTGAADVMGKAFNITDGTSVFDPNSAHFPKVSAAGLLTQRKKTLEATTLPLTLATPTVAAQSNVAGSLTIKIAGGVESSDVIASLVAPSVDAGDIGDWLVVNTNGNVNSFEYIKASNKIVYTGKSITSAADTAGLFFVSNKGISAAISLTGSASLAA
jgi:hypothetical protein